MSDSTINVSGSDQSYAVDAVRLGGSGDYRQIVVIGDHTSSGIAGGAVTVAASALHVSAVGGTVTANLGATDNAVLDTIDAVLDTIKIDTAAVKLDMNAIKVDTAANEVLLAAANVDHAANEVLLTGIDTVLDNILVKNTEIDTALDTIDAVLDTIKVDTEAIETAVESSVANAGNVLTLKRNVIAPVAGLDVNIKPSTSSYLSHVYIDLDGAGDNPTTNTEVIAAPGASTKLVIYGVQGSIVGATAAAYGNWFLSDGNTSAATTLWTGRAQGITNTQFELTFPYGVALTTNTALKVTSTEGSGNIFINAVIYYRTEAT
jgi:hypothetical protein